MASLFILSTPFCTTPFTKSGYTKLSSSLSPPNYATHNHPAAARLFTCIATMSKPSEIVPRRSGNYAPTLWDDRFIPLTSVYTDEKHTKKAEELKDVVRLMIQRTTRPLDQLELIDDIQRLGLSYHFEDIIETTLRNLYNDGNWSECDDLHTTSLQFRLFRYQCFHVSQDVFVKFMDASGDFKPSLWSDAKGLLSLYEASHLSIDGETLLDHARDFSTQHLVNNLNNGKMNDVLSEQVKNALEVPLHWAMLRDQARWFIDIYEQRPNMNSILLEFAKLDFNIVQSAYQNEFKNMSRWWTGSRLAVKAPFARDRMVENYFGSTGLVPEPQEGYCRQIFLKIHALATVLDDMYDVYATLDEMLVFTDAVKRWDINTLDQLPEYMRICYLALFNTVNEMAYDVLKEHGYNPISQLKKSWADLCDLYIIEMRWYHSGYKPTLDEYLNIAWYSVTTPMSLAHVFFSATNYPISKEALECFEPSSSSNNVVRWCSYYFRLWDDLATSSDEMKRGDVPKSIQCYMNERVGATEEEARAHIKILMSQTLKKMNAERFKENNSSPFTKKFIEITMNVCRMSLYVYKHGDGFGHATNLLTDRVLKLLVKPIHMVVTDDELTP